MRRITIVIAGIGGFAVAALTGLAFAHTRHPTLRTAHNAALHETIVVGAKKMTLYELGGESKRHLLCTSALCLQFWPPLKARSAKAKLQKADGVKGKLGIMRRHGFFQVTLGGHPLYYFLLDKVSGDATGNGRNTFGGHWHVVKTSDKSGSGSTTTRPTTTTPTTTTTPSTTTTTPYGY